MHQPIVSLTDVGGSWLSNHVQYSINEALSRFSMATSHSNTSRSYKSIARHLLAAASWPPAKGFGCEGWTAMPLVRNTPTNRGLFPTGAGSIPKHPPVQVD